MLNDEVAREVQKSYQYPPWGNLPEWKKVSIDMDHISSGHMVGGSRVSPLSWRSSYVLGVVVP